jgi:two-component system nitrogen regulation response regulator NtrX
MAALQRHRWRGNIRELRNTVERVMIMAAGDVVRVDDLPPDIRGESTNRPADTTDPQTTPPPIVTPGPGGDPVATGGSGAPGSGTLREFKDASERAFLVQKLRENNWNISKTAEVIDTPRSNLYKKLEQYGIRQEVDG